VQQALDAFDVGGASLAERGALSCGITQVRLHPRQPSRNRLGQGSALRVVSDGRLAPPRLEQQEAKYEHGQQPLDRPSKPCHRRKQQQQSDLDDGVVVL